MRDNLPTPTSAGEQGWLTGGLDEFIKKAAEPYLSRALELEVLIRQHADHADAERRLHTDVGRAFAASGLYRLPAPVSIQGADASAVAQVAVLEAVSAFDASAGWNLMIGMETFGLIGPSMQGCEELVADPMTVLASSTAAIGRAVREGEGYRVTGRWQFVSGVHNAQVFGATVRRYSTWNGEDDPANELIDATPCYALIVEPDFQIIDTWHTVGMRGSGSHDVTVQDVWVPDARMVVNIGNAGGASANLRFPRGARLAYNKVAVALGICAAAIHEFTELAKGKTPRFTSRKLRERPHAQRALAQATARYIGLRAATYSLVADLWQKTTRGAPIAGQELAQFQAVCSDAAESIAGAVHDLAGAAGTSANDALAPLSRIARDATVVRQHLTVAPHHMEDAGRLLLGLPPQEMMLRGIAPED